MWEKTRKNSCWDQFVRFECRSFCMTTASLRETDTVLCSLSIRCPAFLVQCSKQRYSRYRKSSRPSQPSWKTHTQPWTPRQFSHTVVDVDVDVFFVVVDDDDDAARGDNYVRMKVVIMFSIQYIQISQWWERGWRWRWPGWYRWRWHWAPLLLYIIIFLKTMVASFFPNICICALVSLSSGLWVWERFATVRWWSDVRWMTAVAARCMYCCIFCSRAI